MFSYFFKNKKIASREEQIEESAVRFSILLHQKTLAYAAISNLPSMETMWYSRTNIKCSKLELIAALKKRYVQIKDEEEARAAWWELRHHAIWILPDDEKEPVNQLNYDRMREDIHRLERELDQEFPVYEALRKSS